MPHSLLKQLRSSKLHIGHRLFWCSQVT